MSAMGHVVHCRMCLWPVEKVLEMKPTPVANAFTAEPQPFMLRYPLYLTQCTHCGHVQQGFNVPGEVLFGDYRYLTPTAERPRLAALAADLAKRYPHALRDKTESNSKTAEMPRVIEIGSNSGLFVEELNKAGFWAAGVDPSPLAPKTGMPKWFSTKTARQIRDSMGPSKLIVSNNAFAHFDDLRNVLLGCKYLLDTDGALVFEVQYLPKLIERGAFDMIYHEHKDYHQLKTWPSLLKKFGMCVTDVEHLDTHGGSFRMHIRFGEESIPLSDPAIDWQAFRARMDGEKARIASQINGEKIGAFGATAKACTLIHQFGLSEKIAYCIDETPAKQGTYIPGTSIPVVGMEALDDRPILLTAWNYYEVLKQRLDGHRLIVPFNS